MTTVNTHGMAATVMHPFYFGGMDITVEDFRVIVVTVIMVVADGLVLLYMELLIMERSWWHGVTVYLIYFLYYSRPAVPWILLYQGQGIHPLYRNTGLTETIQVYLRDGIPAKDSI